MKLITAIIRPERLPEAKAALFRAGVTGMTVTRVSGPGGESEIIERYFVERHRRGIAALAGEYSKLGRL